MKTAFVGLGAMGYPMAGHLGQRFDTLVWNRTPEKARKHAAEFPTQVLENFSGLRDVDVLFTCLPTTREVSEVLEQVLPFLKAGALWVDCTSGDPVKSLDIAQKLSGHQVIYLDAPVSGGTAGAINGALSVMIGGPEEAVQKAQPVLSAFASKVVHVGQVGSGHAVKAINNMLLAINLLSAGEGLVALAKLGVNLEAALEVINVSSGRSNATQNLIPQRVLTREFPATFALGLLAKDAGIALDVSRAANAPTPLFSLTESLYRAARDTVGASEDHTAVVKMLENWAGVTLSSPSAVKDRSSP
ncbi:NAD(P)-dependent oxidoreductase [Deinococcus roseus]|uniref:3-hydroxyisobutyrate dehydrogenase n=1 Tax=Deinococcus roseus TaxID=392414 RepID=A0ABQ2CUP8_9DEIO|nr:NAD(P)-dependent oxidoreductase [Deinococcus roseus]GGJ22157.1 3-hydroxyisobutyrate dehydrogenase [Deinococcus roseus]